MSSELREADVLVPPPEMAPAVELPAAEKHTYGQILKSSVLIGGSSVLNIGIGIVRTKAMAVLLGPAGFGLMGLYGSIADLAVSIAGMGALRRTPVFSESWAQVYRSFFAARCPH